MASVEVRTMSGWSHLLPPSWKDSVKSWIREDCPSLDYGGFVVGENIQQAHLFCKADVKSFCLKGGIS